MSHMRNWQESGVRLAGMLVDAAAIIQEALPRIKNKQHREEIAQFIQRNGADPLPSLIALCDLEAAVVAIRMMQPEGKGCSKRP